MPSDTWIPFATLANRSAADILRTRLELDGVPVRIESHGLETEFRVLVPAEMLHRARWITSQAPPSDAELEFLATGRLAPSEQQE